ncbi:MAG: ComF family protein [Puniceicoccales bacterium]|nr:ComF family protein [Puniceicoccales bacterium]
MHALWTSVLDFFFPRFCLHCHQRIQLTQEGFICDLCAKEFVLSDGACCQRCGRPMLPEAEHNLVCADCLETNPSFQFGITLFPYKGIGREFIQLLKYKNGQFLKSNLQALFKKFILKLSAFQGSTFVPVPLHYFRRWQRGFNQSEWIANLLSRHCQGKVKNALIRQRYTQSQTHLTREERKVNVSNVFSLKKRDVCNPHVHYVLVDDVFTTGATLNACASTLRKGGAQRISIFALAHG